MVCFLFVFNSSFFWFCVLKRFLMFLFWWCFWCFFGVWWRCFLVSKVFRLVLLVFQVCVCVCFFLVSELVLVVFLKCVWVSSYKQRVRFCLCLVSFIWTKHRLVFTNFFQNQKISRKATPGLVKNTANNKTNLCCALLVRVQHV